MHTLDAVRDPRVRNSAIRSQRVVGRGAPRDVTKLAYSVVAVFGPTAVRQVRRRAGAGNPDRHRGRLSGCAPGVCGHSDPHEPGADADASHCDPRSLGGDVRRRVRNACARRDRRPGRRSRHCRRRRWNRPLPASCACRPCDPRVPWSRRHEPSSSDSTTPIRMRRTSDSRISIPLQAHSCTRTIDVA